MKVTWEADDITPGRRYSKPGIKEVWLIGYIPDVHGLKRYVSVSLNDGMVTDPCEQKNISKSTNGYLPCELLSFTRSDK